jgi:hypothetical protein
MANTVTIAQLTGRNIAVGVDLRRDIAPSSLSARRFAAGFYRGIMTNPCSREQQSNRLRSDVAFQF